MRLRVEADASPQQPGAFIDAQQSKAAAGGSRTCKVEPLAVVEDR